MSSRVFLACAVAAGMTLIGAPAAMATGGGSCTFNLSFVTDGPCLVSDPNNPVCAAEGDYTAIKYTNNGSTVDHLATLVTRNNASIIPVSSSGFQTYTACFGDPLTGLGKYSCHEKAVKINGVPAGQSFWIVVPGQKTPVETSIAAKRNCSGIKSMAILGLGLDLPPVAPVTEILTHENPDTQEKCSVEFTLDKVGGAVLSAKLTPESAAAGCQLRVDKAEDVQVTINDVVLPMKFGQGYFQSGEHSCTTRVVGGKLYTWGNPCPN